jgi:hypothetical protein
VSLSATTEYDRSRQPATPCVAPALATLADHAGPEHDYVLRDARAGCPARWSPPKRLPRDTHPDRSLPTRTEARAEEGTTLSDKPTRRPKPPSRIRPSVRADNRSGRRSLRSLTLLVAAHRSGRSLAKPATLLLVPIRSPATTRTTAPTALSGPSCPRKDRSARPFGVRASSHTVWTPI